MFGNKNKIPVYDGLMSTHWGIAQRLDALFGIKVKDKLCWPPSQIDEEDTVERAPELDCVRLSGVDDLNELVYAYGNQVGDAPLVDPTHPEMMTAARSEYIHEPKLFGGDTQGTGGVEGLFTWLPGKPDQVIPEYMTTKTRLDMPPERCPSFRGLATAFFSGGRRPKGRFDLNGIGIAGIWGLMAQLAKATNHSGFKWGTNDPYVPAPAVRVFRMPVAPPLKDWASRFLNPHNVEGYPQGMTRVIQVPRSPARNKSEGEGKLRPGGGFPAANAAAVCYELLSSESYDKNATEAALDADSFLIAARLLSIEKAGISFAWVDQDSAKAVIEEVCEHVGGAVFIHPKTGLWTMRLLRPDSAFKALELPNEIIKTPWNTGFVLTPSNARLDGEIERKSWSDVVNFLSVKYTDDETSQEKAVSVQADDLIAAAGGGLNVATLNYWMFRSVETAIAAGERSLAVASKPLMKASWLLNRSAWSLAPLDVITVNWPSEGLVNARFRVMSIDYGDGKEREIRVECVEDVFSDIPKRRAVVPQTPLWKPEPRPTMRQPWMTPASAPLLMRHGVSLEEVRTLDAEGDAVMVHLVSSDTLLTGAEAFVRTNDEDLPQTPAVVDSVPRALLKEPLGAEAISTLDFYEMDFGTQERDPEAGDLLIIVRPRPDKPILDRFWTSIGGGRLLPSNLPGEDYGTSLSPHKLHWGVGTAAMALDPDSARSADLRGLAPAFHEEVCVIREVDEETGETTITRGAFDTVPAPIPAGAWVYHVPNTPSVPRQTSPDGALMYAIYRPRNASGEARTTTKQYPFVATARQEMPARPGNVRMMIGGETMAFGAKSVIDQAAAITVSWASRNRLLDDNQPALWTAGNVTPEPGQRHYVRVWRRVRRNADGDAPAVLVQAFYDLAGDSLTVPATTFSGSLGDPDWNPGFVETDITAGGAFVIEVGAQRTEGGRVLVPTPENPTTGPAQMSAQAALLLVDIGTSPGGYGNNWGREWGG